MNSVAPRLWPIRLCVQQAIRVLETWTCKRDPGAVGQLALWSDWPDHREHQMPDDFSNLADVRDHRRWSLLTRAAVERRIPTAICLRVHAPVAHTLALLCAMAAVPRQRAVSGRLANLDFNALNLAVRHLACAPVLVCDARPDRPIETAITALAVRRQASLVFCDWQPDAQELPGLEELSQRHDLAFVFDPRNRRTRHRDLAPPPVSPAQEDSRDATQQDQA